jgi:hypothetical protein
MTLANIAPGKKIRASHMTELQEAVTDGLALIDESIEDFQDQIDAIPGLPEIENIRLGVFNVKDAPYNATGDGVTDDRAAVQLALDAIYAAGGGTLYFPDGDYLIGLRDSPVGFSPDFYISFIGVHLFVYGSNVKITCSPTARILVREGHANGTALFYGVGSLRTPDTVDELMDIPTWTSEVYWFNTAFATYPIYEMDPADAGDDSVTLADPADTANFSVGDGVCIRSGQTLDGQGEAQPDGENNQIVAINAGTGEMSLLFPLAKNYVQEYFPDSGRDEASTTSVTAFPAYMGVQNVENWTARNMAIENCNIDVDQLEGSCYLFALQSVIGGRVVNNVVTGKNTNPGWGASFRDLYFAENRFYLEGTTGPVYFFGADRCCGDYKCINNMFVSRGTEPGIFHLNEGTFGGIITGNHVLNSSVTDANHVIAMRGRGYNTLIANNYIMANNASGNPIYIDETNVNVIVADNIYAGGPTAILNTAVPGRTMGNLGRVGHTVGGNETDVRVSSAWVYYDSAASIEMQPIPSGAYVLSAEVLVFEAFNGAAPTVQVGNSGGYDQFFMDPQSLSAQAHLNARTHPDVQFYQQGGGPRTPEIIYVSGGSTTGKSCIVLTWAQVESGLGV